MRRKAPEIDGEPLFDLPLDQGVDSRTERLQPTSQPELPLEADAEFTEEPSARALHSEPPGDGRGEPPPGGHLGSPFGRRLTAGLLDLAAHIALLALAVGGSAWLGVPPSRLTFLPLVLLGAGFSFIYHVLPLVFWGRTPGMASQGLTARSLDGGPLTMAQAVRRWLGALLNLTLLGVPFVLLRERSLSDRFSGSIVLV